MTVSFELDGEVLLFEPGAGELFLLNSAASVVWLCREDGLSPDEAAEELARIADIPLSQARQDCAAIFSQWENQRLTAAAGPHSREQTHLRPTSWPDPSIVTPAAEDSSTLQRTYQIADFRFVLRSGRTASDTGVHEFLGYLEVPPGTEPAHILDLNQTDSDWQLSLAGKVIDRTKTADGLLPMLHRCLLVAALRGSHAAAALHAGVLLYRGSTILLAGTSGSGKSTLTAALMANGFEYFGDDMALLSRPPVRVRGVPSRVRLLEESWPLILPLWPQLANVPAHRRHDGRMVRYFVPDEYSAPQQPGTGRPADLLIFPQYRENAQLSLEALSRGQALVLLTEAGYNFSEILTERLVRDFIDWLAELDCFRLEYASLDDAVMEIQSLVESSEQRSEQSADGAHDGPGS